MNEVLTTAFVGFAESTRDAIVNMGKVLETHEEDLNRAINTLQSLGNAIVPIQEAILTLAEQLNALQATIDLSLPALDERIEKLETSAQK